MPLSHQRSRWLAGMYVSVSGQVKSGPRRRFCCRVIRPKPLVRDGNPLYFLPSWASSSVSTGIHQRRGTMGTRMWGAEWAGSKAGTPRAWPGGTRPGWGPSPASPMLGGLSGHAHQEGKKVFLYRQEPCHRVWPRSGLPPGLFVAACQAGTQVLADPLPGHVPCAPSHTVVTSLPRSTKTAI